MKNEYEIEINLYTDWINFLRVQLQKMKCIVNKTFTEDQISLGYFHILHKRISQRPREVIISKEFSCPSSYQGEFRKIQLMIRKGKDLSPHLSKNIIKLNQYDNLLSDWGIHHLHLSTVPGEAGFVERTGPILFARFTDTTAFLINIMEHGKGIKKKPWSNQELIQIIHNNWPDSISDFRVQGIKGTTFDFSDEDIERSRASGLQTVIKVEDAVYVPIGGGYSITRTGANSHISANARIYTNIHIHKIKYLEDYVRKNYLQLLKIAEQKGVVFSSKLKFKLQINKSQIQILEEASRQCWIMPGEFKDGMLKIYKLAAIEQ